jgi:ABC-type polysaccharide/polyol phosphate export permease
MTDPLYLARTAGLLRTLWTSRRLIWQLARHELRARYAATVIGSVWAIVNPIVLIVVFWFVSAYGLRITFEQGPPYFLVVFCALVPWMTFSDALSGGASAILNHRYLAKKIAFPLEILPVVSVVTALIVHVFLLALLLVILLVSGVRPTWHIVQASYFLLALLVLATGLSWALSALNVFTRDVSHALTAMLTIWFWMTPILWPSQNLSGTMLLLIQLNPVFYIVEGYRNALLYQQPLTAMWPLDVYFWGVAALVFLGGALVFKRLKPHFADVL